MFSYSTPADALNILALIVGAVLLLRKMAESDSHHRLRLVVLTTVFSLPVIFFFLRCIRMFTGPHFDCVVLEYTD